VNRLCSLSLAESRAGLDAGEFSSLELTCAYLERIEKLNPELGAYLLVTDELALAQARAADDRIAAGAAGPLTGIPIALKDVLATRGVRTTCASRMLAEFVPPYDAFVVERLREAGAVFLGKANMDEFAMGSSNENSAFYPVRNPWNLDRVPGGSSGGSAAAVAADLAVAALGSDTGGSIRQPASLCGTVGLKPTYGRVSRYGLVAFASSLDQIGPITKTVRDAAALLGAIAGHDPRDSTSLALSPEDFEEGFGRSIAGLRIGVPVEYFSAGLDPRVETAVMDSIALFADLGAEPVRVSLPHTRYALSTYYLLAPAEASSNLARFHGVRYGLRVDDDDVDAMMSRTRGAGFGAEVKRRIMLGTYALAAGYYDAFYLKAQKARTLIRADFDRAFEQCDLLLAATSPTTAFALGERSDDPLSMYLSDVLTIPANIAGLPAISVPCGFAEGLPVGLQLIGGELQEKTLLQAAHAFERAAHVAHRAPARAV
jgi:aspartyl-tRNA(Asn)/glutamyl-tRNA(Gln) amidotransferase subunit A